MTSPTTHAKSLCRAFPELCASFCAHACNHINSDDVQLVGVRPDDRLPVAGFEITIGVSENALGASLNEFSHARADFQHVCRHCAQPSEEPDG